MGLRWHGAVTAESVAAIDPARLARWWAEVLRVELLYERHDAVALPGLVFVPADEAGPVNSRPRFELDSDDLTADVEKLLDMGARRVDIDQAASDAMVLADPEGNQFRVLPPR